MGISKADLGDRDVYMDYDFEEVMVRFEHRSRRFFCRLYGSGAEVEVRFDDRLLNDALLFGTEVDAATYQAGKPAA